MDCARGQSANWGGFILNEPLLQVAAVTFSYRTSGPSIVQDLSLEISSGEICALLGPNGSGKTTYMRLLCGLLSPSSGAIRFKGRDSRQMSVSEIARMITYVPSELSSEFPITVREVVTLGRDVQADSRLGFGLSIRPEDTQAVDEAMQATGCMEFSETLIQELSHGQRQLVALSRAIAQGSKIIALDETFSKMDLHHQVKMSRLLETLAAKGHAILWVVHDFNLALDCAHTGLLLDRGKRVAYGKIHEVVNGAILKKVYPTLKFETIQSPLNGKLKLFFA